MQYVKITDGETIIEFHNNWLGEETVIVNGQVVSKKSSILGCDHYFSVIDDGRNNRYILTSKINGLMQVLLDVRKNGKLIEENVLVKYGAAPRKPRNKFKKSGRANLQEYDVDDAIKELKLAAEFDPKDPEIYFFLACAYSINEQTQEGFEALKMAVKYNLKDTDAILTHDMLAFLRMHPAFEGFLDSNFSEYDASLMKDDPNKEEI